MAMNIMASVKLEINAHSKLDTKYPSALNFAQNSHTV